MNSQLTKASLQQKPEVLGAEIQEMAGGRCTAGAALMAWV